MTRRLTSILAVAVAVVGQGRDPASPLGKLDVAVRSVVARGSTEATRVILRVNPTSRERLVAELRARGDAVLAQHPSVGAMTVRIRPNEIASLAADRDVESISADAVVMSAGGPGRNSSGRRSEIYPSGKDQLTPDLLRLTLGLGNRRDRQIFGDGVGVAVIDSGITVSEDIPAERITAFFDFTNGAVASDPYDDYGHGTHVAGLIGSSGVLSQGEFEGVAPGVHFIGLKVLDSTGAGLTSDVIRAVDFAVANKNKYKIDVINLSLGHPIYQSAATDPLVQAVERAVGAGIVVVASAGNFGRNPDTGVIGYGGITTPGNAPSAITVGSLNTNGTVTRSDDSVSTFSSRGPTWIDGFQKPDLVAPGAHLVSDVGTASMLATQLPGSLVTPTPGGAGSLLQLSGTSMSAAVTSGVVALVIEAGHQRSGSRNFPELASLGGRFQAIHFDFRNLTAVRRDWSPGLPPNAVKAVLEFTSFPLPDADPLTQGAGALNAAGAISLARALDPAKPVGTWWLGYGVSPQTTIAGERLVWAQRIVWGDRVIWGDQLYSNDPAWGQRVVWGDRVIWGDRVVWGDRIVWGDRVIWGDSTVWSERVVWGDRIVWGDNAIGYADATRVIWGDLTRIVWGDSTRIVWGDMKSVLGAYPEAVWNQSVDSRDRE